MFILFADGTRGVVCGREKSTCFPVAAMRGATFNTKLEEQVGEAIAEEAIEAGANLFGGVCVNLPLIAATGKQVDFSLPQTTPLVPSAKYIGGIPFSFIPPAR